MPGQRLRQPHRVAIEMLNPLAMLAAAFIVLWAVILQPMWQSSRALQEPSQGQPTLAARASKPT